MSESQEIVATIEALRKDKYSDLPGALVAEILRIEAEFVENRVEAAKRINRSIEQFLAGESSSK